MVVAFSGVFVACFYWTGRSLGLATMFFVLFQHHISDNSKTVASNGKTVSRNFDNRSPCRNPSTVHIRNCFTDKYF